jgi:alpha-2-macroglobulin
LILDDKPEAAAKQVAAIRAAARAAGREEEWTRALIQEAQLRVRNAPETAIRLLRDEPWPASSVDRAVLHLYLGQALDAYYTSQSWTIDQREQIGTPRALKELDLGTATQAELFAAMTSEYLEVWRRREILSAVPVQSLVRYILPSDYPPEVRGTARDTVSYLFAANLADSTFWSPRESNELFRVDLGRLIGGQGEDPADATAHPIARMAGVLGDLEAWHRAAGRRAAALEARLERLRLLRTAFTGEKDRALLRRSLEESLPAFRDTVWWSMGMATLADFVREENGQDHLARADRIARDGYAASPQSRGGIRCLSIARSIEAPDFEMVTMKSDAPDRRSIRVRHKNLGALWFRLYAIDPLQQVERPRAGFLLYPEEKDLAALIKTSTPVASWRTELPPTPDFAIHTTYVVPPVQRRGAYLVVASARADFAKEKNRRAAASLFLGDLVLQSQLSGDAFEVVALSGEDGHPVSGAEVRLYSGVWNGGRLQRTGTTGADGRVRLTFAGEDYGYFVMARQGEDFALLDGLSAWSPPRAPDDDGATLVYTDRAVYRPGQKILWKVLAYRRKDRLSPPTPAPGTEVTVTLLDQNQQTVATKTVRANDFGTASGEVEIPPGRPLGLWRLQTAPQGGATIQVEEYKRPTFEVVLKDPRGALHLNRPARFEGGARYYFGLPVAAGTVRWRAYRVPVMPDWWRTWYSTIGRANDQVVAAGTAELSAEGSFEVAFTPEADPNAGEDVTFRYRIEAEVTDEGGETREAERSFRLGQIAVEARIQPAADLFVAGRPAHVKIVRTDLDGVPRPGAGTWTLLSLRQPERALLPADQPWPKPGAGGGYQTPGDALRPRDTPDYKPDEILRNWPDGARIGGGTLEHGKDGAADLELPPDLPAGAYRLRYETRDEATAGDTVDAGDTGLATAARELIVAGPRTPLALPAVLAVDRSEAHVGGTLRLLAGSGLSGQPATLELYQDGRVIERRALAADGAPSLIEIPLGEEHQGGLAMRLLAVRDHQVMDLTDSAFVPWDRGLFIELSTFRDRVRPGAHETWRVTVRQPGADAGHPEAAAAEVLAYLYDRSLDPIARQYPPQVLGLFPQRTQRIEAVESVGARTGNPFPGIGWGEAARIPQALRPDRLRLALGHTEDSWLTLTTTSGLVMNRIDFDGVKRPRPMTREVQQRLGGEIGFVEGGVEGGVAGGVVGGTPGGVMSGEPSAPPPPPPPPPPPAFSPPREAPRSDFAETALWAPHLLTGADGSATIEVDFPDSVTSWNFYLHAVTRDLRSASTLNQVESVKDLMVRPYLPRFLREGDQADLKAVVNNSSQTELRGQVDFDLVDPETGESRLADFGLDRTKARLPFTAAPGGGVSLTFPVTAPKQVGSVAVRVTASAGDLSDGELRPVPILPSRLHLAQSRFVALRGPGGDRRTMAFPDLAKGGDPTRIDEQMVVTLDAQLFSGVLQALPYLRQYPYECTEQTLNRFLSTAIVSSVFDRYPAIAKAAREMAARDTRYETWDAADPNRKMALEETPWLQMAQGGRRGEDDEELLRVLDPRVARAEKASALARLEKSQLADGAFPWWPGGPPSPYMTAYTLYGFAKAREHGVDVPRPVVQKAWKYLGDNFRAYDHAELKTRACCWEGLVLLNYVSTAFPDPAWTVGGPTLAERRAILDATFRNRQSLSPYLKAMLALTLKRMGREADGRLVLDGLLDAAKTTPDEGTFWTAEDRSWLWYNDTIESHAMILRALSELRPGDARADGLVQWLFLNKKLNHWKSTRATAEVIYALVHYLEKENQLGQRETATVHLGQRTESYTFEPDSSAARKAQLVVPGNEIDPAVSSTIVVEKETPGFLFASATWHFSTEELPKEERGDLFGVACRYFRRVKTDRDTVLQPLAEGDLLHPGDEVEIHLTIRSKAPAEYVHLRDPRPAGLEPGLAVSGYRYDLGLIRYEETRDSGTNFFFENLPQGEYTLKYRLRANLAGTFRTGPATLQSMYAPEFTAYSTGTVVRVEE